MLSLVSRFCCCPFSYSPGSLKNDKYEQLSTKLIDPEETDDYDRQKKTQDILDKNARAAVLSHKFENACIMREKGASHVVLLPAESEKTFPNLRCYSGVPVKLKALNELNAQKAMVIFSPACMRMVMLDHLNAVMNCIVRDLNPGDFYHLRYDMIGPERLTECAKLAGDDVVTHLFMEFVRWNVVTHWKVDTSSLIQSVHLKMKRLFFVFVPIFFSCYRELKVCTI